MDSYLEGIIGFFFKFSFINRDMEIESLGFVKVILRDRLGTRFEVV